MNIIHKQAGICLLWLLFSTQLQGQEKWTVGHIDPLAADPNLSLKDVVTVSLSRYPQYAVLQSMAEEATALEQRGNSWLSGSPDVSFQYEGEQPGEDVGFYAYQTEFNLPLWRWNQRNRGQNLAKKAAGNMESYTQLLHFQVAGLARESLWDLALQEKRWGLANEILKVADRLVISVKRRVELGDLARSDLLLAQRYRLEKRSKVNQAEAEVMHARKRYSSLTGLQSRPAVYEEEKSKIVSIPTEHPALLLANSEIAVKMAELKWLQAAGSGSPVLSLGLTRWRDQKNEPITDGFNAKITLPFGGGAHTAPGIAGASRSLTEVQARHKALFRNLSLEFHEATHALEVDETELKIAKQAKAIAEDYLRLSRIGFDAGEIRLFDLLKIEAEAHTTIGNAEQRAIMLKRDIARYNQTVGELP